MIELLSFNDTPIMTSNIPFSSDTNYTEIQGILKSSFKIMYNRKEIPKESREYHKSIKTIQKFQRSCSVHREDRASSSIINSIKW